jgi:hypothetical protein
VATPYLTAAALQQVPAGLSWTVVPTLTASSDEQLAQLQQCCWKATAAVDTYCKQPLRATAVTEPLDGPNRPRVSVDRDSGIATLITRQWPVTQVLAVQVSPARCFPEEWTLVPANQYRIRHPVLLSMAGMPQTGPSGGNAIDVAPQWINRDRGPGYWSVLVSYASGWPHAGLAAAAEQGTTTLTVDDVTGWTGYAGFIYDGPSTEFVQVTAAEASVPVQLPGVAGTAQAGPGTLTLASPLAFAHDAGAAISALPMNVIHSAGLHAAVEALETIDAIATQSLNGQMAGGTGVLAEQAELLIDGFCRVA